MRSRKSSRVRPSSSSLVDMPLLWLEALAVAADGRSKLALLRTCTVTRDAVLRGCTVGTRLEPGANTATEQSEQLRVLLTKASKPVKLYLSGWFASCVDPPLTHEEYFASMTEVRHQLGSLMDKVHVVRLEYASLDRGLHRLPACFPNLTTLEIQATCGDWTMLACKALENAKQLTTITAHSLPGCILSALLQRPSTQHVIASYVRVDAPIVLPEHKRVSLTIESISVGALRHLPCQQIERLKVGDGPLACKSIYMLDDAKAQAAVDNVKQCACFEMVLPVFLEGNRSTTPMALTPSLVPLLAYVKPSIKMPDGGRHVYLQNLLLTAETIMHVMNSLPVFNPPIVLAVCMDCEAAGMKKRALKALVLERGVPPHVCLKWPPYW